ncbi:hypothetical protein [Deinococcus maricopensis]|uniref:hypothetical protein n=1 Tax=Deinococcus maricopensis TaxID=309887 RepID=UPI0002DCADE8|nr:hypothetical protein [Deinococcus maricopensis]
MRSLALTVLLLTPALAAPVRLQFTPGQPVNATVTFERVVTFLSVDVQPKPNVRLSATALAAAKTRWQKALAAQPVPLPNRWTFQGAGAAPSGTDVSAADLTVTLDAFDLLFGARMRVDIQANGAPVGTYDNARFQLQLKDVQPRVCATERGRRAGSSVEETKLQETAAKSVD